MSVTVDKTYICNQALMEMGVDASIESLNEDSVYAERCNRLYDSVLRSLLSQYNWSFTEKLVTLARISDNIEGYSFAYNYPSEAFRINNVYQNEEDYKIKKVIPEIQKWRVATVNGNKCILSNSEIPFAAISIEPLISDCPESFIRVFILRLAEQLSKVSGANDAILQRIKSDLQYELSMALINSSRESNNQLSEDNPYVDVRG